MQNSLSKVLSPSIGDVRENLDFFLLDVIITNSPVIEIF